jgi:hypothetical protein
LTRFFLRHSSKLRSDLPKYESHERTSLTIGFASLAPSIHKATNNCVGGILFSFPKWKMITCLHQSSRAKSEPNHQSTWIRGREEKETTDLDEIFLAPPWTGASVQHCSTAAGAGGKGSHVAHRLAIRRSYVRTYNYAGNQLSCSQFSPGVR